ncbi:MAG TPA: ABC transporter permease [Pseudolabrys sp.]|jgi:NitT/TauT family transport system permease protein
MKHSVARANTSPLPLPNDVGGAVMNTITRAWRSLALIRRVLLPVLLAAAVVLVWEFGTRAAHISPMVVVPPSAVWQVIAASSGILLQQAVPTVEETLIGFALASVIGVVLGTALVLSHRVRQALYPHILAFQLIPKVALAPLFIVWFGVGPTSRLSLAVFMAFFPVVVSTATGLMSADRNVVRMAASATASPWQIFTSVRVPYAMPHIFSGLKVAVTMAMIGVIVGEFVTAQAGLGYIIMMASSAAETALVFAAIVLLCVAGLALYGAVALAEWLIERRMGVSITTSEF